MVKYLGIGENNMLGWIWMKINTFRAIWFLNRYWEEFDVDFKLKFNSEVQRLWKKEKS